MSGVQPGKAKAISPPPGFTIGEVTARTWNRPCPCGSRPRRMFKNCCGSPSQHGRWAVVATASISARLIDQIGKVHTGPPVMLLTVGGGGNADDALRLYEAIRDFAPAGGTVVMYALPAPPPGQAAPAAGGNTENG
jgi:hypothetical protein